jgi:hypothetical protein
LANVLNNYASKSDVDNLKIDMANLEGDLADIWNILTWADI